MEPDAENSYLAGDELEAGPIVQLLGSSITCRIAVGPQQGRKVFTLQTLPGCDEPFDGGVGKVAGFYSAVQVGNPADLSLHTCVAARADQRQKLERLCRYISRPAIAEQRLSLTPNGNIRYDVKGFTSVAGAWMRRSDPAEDAVPRRHYPRHLMSGILPSALRASLRLLKIAPSDFVEPLDFIARWRPWRRNRGSI